MGPAALGVSHGRLTSRFDRPRASRSLGCTDRTTYLVHMGDESRGAGERGAGHWFEALAEDLGSAYLRYSFTKGTRNEVEFLIGELGLEPGQRLLDVGCGPGRHAHAFAAAGIEVVGIDISQHFVDLATDTTPAGVPASFQRCDARNLPFEGEFDAAISLCQGAFGLVGAGPGTEDGVATAVDPDGVVLNGIARALRPRGRVAVSAFSAYFAVRYLEDFDTFDAARGVNHERTTVMDEHGKKAEHDLWTSCFTPRELRLLADRADIAVDGVWAVTPGEYARHDPDLDHPEFLLVGTAR